MKSCGVTIQMKPLLQNLCIVKARFMDTRLIWTPHYYRQFSLSLGKKPDISSIFNQLKTDTLLIQTFSMVHSVSILKVSNCIYFFWIFNFCDFFELAYCGAYYSDIYLRHKVTGYINRIII